MYLQLSNRHQHRKQKGKYKNKIHMTSLTCNMPHTCVALLILLFCLIHFFLQTKREQFFRQNCLSLYQVVYLCVCVCVCDCYYTIWYNIWFCKLFAFTEILQTAFLFVFCKPLFVLCFKVTVCSVAWCCFVATNRQRTYSQEYSVDMSSNMLYTEKRKPRTTL